MVHSSEVGKCDKHGDFEIKVFETSLGVTIRLDRCAKCQEENLCDFEIEALERKRKDTEERAKEFRRRRGEKTKLPERFANKTFSVTKELNAKQKVVLSACKGYAEKFEELKKEGVSMIMCGKTGAGKTHLAACIANHIKEHHQEFALMTTVSKLIREIRSSYNNKEKTESDMIELFCKPSLLIIDEVGVQFGTDAEKVTLFDVMNERYERMLPTILIGNLTLSEFKEYTSERIVDRMKENGGRVLVFDWESQR